MTTLRLPYQDSETELTEKKSRFIGNVFVVYSEQEAKERIIRVRAAHPAARHVVFAYDIRGENAARYSDDSEPKGTAGLPVYETFRREDLTNYCCTVTRYFGGILLGASGLTRAYANTASLALNAAGIARLSIHLRVRIICAYSFYDILRLILRDYPHTVLDTLYQERVQVELQIAEKWLDPLAITITNRSAGDATIETLEQIQCPEREDQLP